MSYVRTSSGTYAASCLNVAGTGSISVNEARYVLDGGLCTITAVITVTTTSGVWNRMTLSLPFTAASLSSTGGSGVGTILKAGGPSAPADCVPVYLEHGGTTANIHFQPTTSITGVLSLIYMYRVA